MKALPIPVPTGGIRADLDAQDIGPNDLRDSKNWINRDGKLQTRDGVGIDGLPVAGRIMAYAHYFYNDGTPRTISGTTRGWFRRNISAGQWDNITGVPLTGSRTDHQTFKVFQKAGQTWLLGTNGADTPKVWDGVSPAYVDMGGSPPRARAMGVVADRIILGNLLSGGTISPVATDVSSNKDFDSGWGSQLVTLHADTPGAIVSIDEIGNLLGAIWKTDALYLAIAQGTADPFRFELKQRLSTEDGLPTGPCSSAVVLTLGDAKMMYIGLDGAGYMFDGGRVARMHPKIQRYILMAGDRSRLTSATGGYNSERHEVTILFCGKGSLDPNIGIVIDLNTNAVWPVGWSTHRFTAIGFGNRSLTIGELAGTIGEQPDTIGAYANANITHQLFGDINGQTYKEQFGGDFRYSTIGDLVGDIGDQDPFRIGDYFTIGTPAPVQSYFETGLNSLGTARQYKTVHGVEHFFEKTPDAQNVTVKLGISNFGEDRVLSSGVTTDIQLAQPHRTGFRKSGRRFSLRYEASSIQQLIYRGAEAEVIPRNVK